MTMSLRLPKMEQFCGDLQRLNDVQEQIDDKRFQDICHDSSEDHCFLEDFTCDNVNIADEQEHVRNFQVILAF